METNDSGHVPVEEDDDAAEIRESGEHGADPEKAPGHVPDVVIVGIGASAGGLTPLNDFFDQMPAGSGLAFVVIQHLSPRGQSLLSDLLRRHTPMKVHHTEEGMLVVQNTVYVVPPGPDWVLRGGRLHTHERGDAPGDVHLPIDIFFRSLAEDAEVAAVGIVLSGTGSDGSLGLQAIKESGGLTLAQSPNTAEQASMPQRAIETGAVDYVLPASAMPDLLLDHAAQLQKQDRLFRDLAGAESNALKTVLAVLHAQTGHDFGLYRQSAILRRIQRRMMLYQILDIGEYARHLHQNPDESQVLLRDLLIGVTEFFRDPEAFEALREHVLPDLLDKGAPDDSLRVWVPACATGEEAYSLAILIREYLDEKKLRVPVQIFATDIDARAIDKARRGIYYPSIAAQVSPERLERFFVAVNGNYQVADAVREMIIFAPQSIVKDPPFSNIHLVSCRNFLIYLEPELQRAVLAVLAYALRPGGYLFLGASETPMQSPAHFEVVERRWRIYRRLEGRAELNVAPLLPGAGRAPTGLPGKPDAARQDVAHRAVERFLLENHLPPCLIVDREGHILFIYGPTGRYLEPASGQAGVWHVVRLMRNALRMPLVTAIRRAAGEGRPVRVEGLRFELEGRSELTNVNVTPLYQTAALRGLFLVMFERPRSAQVPAAEPAPAIDSSSRQREADLERELQDTTESLQTTVEELQSANEEAHAVNEELQSANEELVTAQEEAQSVNEELVTLNSELNAKVDELQVANADLTNLLASIDVGIVFLDSDFHVRRFNRAATEVVNLIPSDVGRPIGHISSRLLDVDWLTAAQVVLQNMIPYAGEVGRDDGRLYSMRIKPYRTAESAVEGVIVTFNDITPLKKVEQELRRAQVGELVETAHEPLVVVDADLRVQKANRSFYRTFHLEPQETEGSLLYELGRHQWDIPRLRELLETIIPRDAVFEGFEVEHEFGELGRRHMVLNARRLDARDGQPDLILLAIREGRPGEPDEREPG